MARIPLWHVNDYLIIKRIYISTKAPTVPVRGDEWNGNKYTIYTHTPVRPPFQQHKRTNNNTHATGFWHACACAYGWVGRACGRHRCERNTTTIVAPGISPLAQSTHTRKLIRDREMFTDVATGRTAAKCIQIQHQFEMFLDIWWYIWIVQLRQNTAQHARHTQTNIHSSTHAHTQTHAHTHTINTHMSDDWFRHAQ